MSYEENKLLSLKDGQLLLKTLDERKAEYPSEPSENGEYVLTVTVNNGTVTLGWAKLS